MARRDAHWPGGQVKYSDLAIATALTLRAVFRLALRKTEGLIGSILQLLGLDLAVPDHSTLSRRAEVLAVPQAGSEPVHLLPDSTGLQLCGPSRWLIEKHGTKRRRAWKMLRHRQLGKGWPLAPGPVGTRNEMVSRQPPLCRVPLSR